MRLQNGRGLAETLVVMTLIGLGLAVALPAAAELGAGARGAAAAREIAVLLHALRWRAVARGASAGLLFQRDRTGWLWWEVADGNGNGLRTAELASGTDRLEAGPYRLEDRVSGARLGFPGPGPFPAVPPRGGTIGDLDDPIQFGRSDLVAFGPLGSASSGTIYLTDGRLRLYAVVLYGRSARVRVWRWDARRRQWKL